MGQEVGLQRVTAGSTGAPLHVEAAVWGKSVGHGPSFKPLWSYSSLQNGTDDPCGICITGLLQRTLLFFFFLNIELENLLCML